MTIVNIEGVDINMEIDKGSGKTLISYKEYQDNFSGIPLQQSHVKLKMLTGETIKLHRKVKVKVKGVMKTLPLCVVGEKDTTRVNNVVIGLKR